MAVRTIALFQNQQLSAGESATSGVIDIREANGSFSIASRVSDGTAGTVGNTVLTFEMGSTENGPYVTPSSAVAIGTNGTANQSDIFPFLPGVVSPFLKIIATQGTDGNDSKLTAELLMR